MNRILSLVVFSAFSGLVLVSAGGKGTQESGVLQVVKSFNVGAAVKESTARFVPQINETFRSSHEMPENPLPPIALGTGTGNSTAPFGGTQPYVRAKAGPMFPGIGATGWVPPDPTLAVGPSHIIETVNSSLAFFNKPGGVKTFQVTMDGASGFFGSVGATDFVFDPKCYYDRTSGRFIVLALELSDPEISKLLIAVSDDSNPTGNWFKYRIEAKLTIGANTYWMDYPSLGVNKDAIVVCGNMFAMSGSSGFGGVEFVCMKKAPMLSGGATTVNVLRDANAGSAQVAQMSDATSDKIYGLSVTSTNSVRLYGITALITTPAVAFTTVSIPNFTPRNRPSFSTNGRSLDEIDSRPYVCSWRAGRLVASHHTQLSSGDDRSSCRWYSFLTKDWPTSAQLPTLEQSGAVSGASGQDFHFPAVVVNGSGDIGMIFARSSTSITADVMVTGRKASDTLGAMGAPVLMQQSTDPNYGAPGTNRWGDYYSAQSDPSDDKVVWGVGMTSTAGGNWATSIHSWTIGSAGGGSGTPFDALTASVFVGALMSGDVVSVRVTDNNFFTVVSTLMQGLGQAAGVETTYQISQTTVSSLGVKVTAKSTVGTTGMVWLFNWSTNSYEFVKSFNIPASQATTQTIMATGNLGRFVNGSKQVKAVVRSHAPAKQKLPFFFSVDLQQLTVTFP